MTRAYTFHVNDVTCEHCEARVQDALRGLAGAEDVQLARVPEDRAHVVFTATADIPRTAIEQVISDASAGTTHTYTVDWDGA
jgi:copper chaperone CopZ